jgi:spermidine synthase
VAQAAVRSFGMEQLGVRVVVMDALAYTGSAPAGDTDVLLVDVFDDMVLPGRFREPAFFKDCRRIVGPNGAVLMNVWPSDLSRRVAKAMRRGGFDEVTAIDAGHGNVLLWAGPFAEVKAPEWMRLEQRFTP